MYINRLHVYKRDYMYIHRFKGSDLIDGVPEELWTEVHETVQEAGIKTIPKGNKNAKR